uniref:Fe2OG dioxygenase domain-containing protein n=1 Tax=Ciona savignyi TaxID=51511 RepID=H2Y735_CIOSA
LNIQFQQLVRISESASKRLNKKMRKIRMKLESDNLRVVEDPTPFVVIANAGVGNMVCSTELMDVLCQYGRCSLPVLCNKSYAIAEFQTEFEAKSMVENIQGYKMKKKVSNEYSTFYCFYLSEIPNNKLGVNETDGLPSGLVKIDNFLSSAEEIKLIECIQHDINTTTTNHVTERLKHRTVLHFGYKFRYGTNDVDINKPISYGLPSYVAELLDRIIRTGYLVGRPDQLTINIYEPGDGIPPHIDNPHSFDPVLSTVSLGSHVVMNFSKDDQCIDVSVGPCTLLLFTGDSRYLWKHGITQRKFDLLEGGAKIVNRDVRYSLTFRKVVKPEVDLPLPVNEDEASSLESSHVHAVYDKIADHFSSTREKPWPRVVEFLHGLEEGSMVLDVGCGSGRYLGVCPHHFILGCDQSSSLINICARKQFTSFVCNGLRLPVRSNSVDACICIAVVHHYANHQRRTNAVRELLRVIKPGGKILIYAWAIEQTCNNVKSKYLKEDLADDISKVEIEPSQPRLAVHVNRTNFKQQDLLVPWKSRNFKSNGDESTYYRYYHVFKEGELEDLCRSIAGCEVLHSYHDNGNWCVVISKS